MDELMDGKTNDQDRKVTLQAPNQLQGRVTWIMEPEGRRAETCFPPRSHNLPSVSSAIMMRLLIWVTIFLLLNLRKIYLHLFEVLSKSNSSEFHGL